MTTLIAFHGEQKVKDKYLKRVRAHAKADQIVKGKYWEGGKGCAVGCTIHGSDHMSYESELGISSVIAHLEDSFFEELPNELAMTFPQRFLEAVTPGADLSLVPAKLMVWQFEDEKYGIKHIAEVKEDKELLKVCEDIVKNYKKVIAGKKVSDKTWEDLFDRAGSWARAWSRSRSRSWAGAGAGAWARSGAWAGAGARSWAGARAGSRALARAGAWAWARAGARAWAGSDYDKLYAESITATSEKFLELLRECK